MKAKTGVRRLLPAALLAAASALVPAPAGAEAVKPCISIVAPAPDAALPPGNVLVIGTAEGEGLDRVQVDVNGKDPVSAGVSGGGFSITVRIPKGRSVIRVTGGKTVVSLPVTGDAKGGYRYHPDAQKCDGCHERRGGRYGVTGRLDAVCYRCHDRMDGGKVVHGPLGGGDCSACHDPHGSVFPSLTVARPETLCVACHDQESSAKHLARAAGKPCTNCHAAHSSEKKYLQK